MRDIDRREFLKKAGVLVFGTALTGVLRGVAKAEVGLNVGSKPPYSPEPGVTIKDLPVTIKDFSVPAVEKTPMVANPVAKKEFLGKDVAVPRYYVETDEDNGFGQEGAKKIEAVIEDIKDYYLKTFGVPAQVPEGPLLVAKAPRNSNPKAYSYGKSKDYPNGAIFVQSPDAGVELAHEVKHSWPLPYEDGGLLQMDGVDHFGGELGTVAAARQWGIDRRGVEPLYFDEGSLLHQTLRRDDQLFVKLNEKWVQSGKPDPKKVSKETWQNWAEDVSPGFKEWLGRVREGPVVDRKEGESMDLKWDFDAEKRVGEGGYVRWYDENLPWFMPYGSSPIRLGPNKYSVTKFAGGTTYPDVGPKGSTPYADMLFSPQKPLGRWVRGKRQ